jgi:putative Holliday junction resolvase
MRLLAIDLGRARIGLAVGDPAIGLPTALPALAATGTLAKDAQALEDLLRRHQAEGVILGMPEPQSPVARAAHKLGVLLSARGWPVHFVDESLTTVEADAAMAGSELTAAQRRRRRDGEAACRIWERYAKSQG